MSFAAFLWAVASLLLGAAIGVMLSRWWQCTRQDAVPPIPAKWPLRARGLLTTEELAVLKWLTSCFPEHLVMAKLPVVRFTHPEGKEKTEKGKELQALLDGVYCAFTVTTKSGMVVGCVDVLGQRGLPRGSRDLKESLLSDCNIAYTVIRASDLPPASAIRAAFLGEVAPVDQLTHEETIGGDSGFHADLRAFNLQSKRDAKIAALKRLNKDNDANRSPHAPGGFNADGTPSAAAQKPKNSSADWEDSFIQPGDTRPGKLEQEAP